MYTRVNLIKQQDFIRMLSERYQNVIRDMPNNKLHTQSRWTNYYIYNYYRVILVTKHY